MIMYSFVIFLTHLLLRLETVITLKQLGRGTKTRRKAITIHLLQLNSEYTSDQCTG